MPVCSKMFSWVRGLWGFENAHLLIPFAVLQCLQLWWLVFPWCLSCRKVTGPEFLPQPVIIFCLPNCYRDAPGFHSISRPGSQRVVTLLVGIKHWPIHKKSCNYVGLLGHTSPQYWACSFPIVCAVLALGSWNYCPWEQGMTSQHPQRLLIWHHWVRGCGIPCIVHCGKGIYIRWQHLIPYLTDIVQLFKEYCIILQICWAVGPCSPEQ